MYMDAAAEVVTEPLAYVMYALEDVYAALLFPAATDMVVIWLAGTMDTEPATICAAAAPARERARMTEFMSSSRAKLRQLIVVTECAGRIR